MSVTKSVGYLHTHTEDPFTITLLQHLNIFNWSAE